MERNGRHAFDAYVQSCPTQLRVARAGLLFALDRYPDLPMDRYLEQLDRFADRAAQRAKGDDWGAQVTALREVLTEESGLKGRVCDFYDPRASYLNNVLDQGHGLPITLSVIWLDVAERLEWPFHGVCMPGHFLIARPVDDGHVVIDPFSGGHVLDHEGCAAILQRYTGRPTAVAPEMFTPASKCAILTRMLNNLRALYCTAQRWREAETVVHRLLALHPDNEELRDLRCRFRRLLAEQN